MICAGWWVKIFFSETTSYFSLFTAFFFAKLCQSATNSSESPVNIKSNYLAFKRNSLTFKEKLM